MQHIINRTILLLSAQSANELYPNICKIKQTKYTNCCKITPITKEPINKRIIPQTIKKEIRDAIHGQENIDEAVSLVQKGKKAKKKDKEILVKELEKQMKEAAKALDFERAMELRDMMLELQGEV